MVPYRPNENEPLSHMSMSLWKLEKQKIPKKSFFQPTSFEKSCANPQHKKIKLGKRKNLILNQQASITKVILS